MKILCTHPGKYGDLLWALPTVRALAMTGGSPVDLLIPDRWHSLGPLLVRQPYIGRVHYACRSAWPIEETAPITPWAPNREAWHDEYDLILHLGYRQWPRVPLPYEVLDTVCEQLPTTAGWTQAPLARERVQTAFLLSPWITLGVPTNPPVFSTLATFTDEWFELKYGVVELLGLNQVAAPGSRWTTEGRRFPSVRWTILAEMMLRHRQVVADCAAPHVLACALGVPVILLEPAEGRHHPIFYPFGMGGPEVLVVKGNDGKPTFDARHLREVLERRG